MPDGSQEVAPQTGAFSSSQEGSIRVSLLDVPSVCRSLLQQDALGPLRGRRAGAHQCSQERIFVA